MTSEQFVYWLQGFTELNPAMEAPTPEQWRAIREHLATVFLKVTPVVKTVGPAFADPARQFTPFELLQRGMGIPPVITC